MTADPIHKLKPDLSFEIALWDQGIDRVAGVDEAGRGALAGPVCSAVVILPADASVVSQLDGVRDSKMMTPSQRTYWAEVIQDVAIGFGVSLLRRRLTGSGSSGRHSWQPSGRCSSCPNFRTT